jgi:CRISPR-associated protein Cmr6
MSSRRHQLIGIDSKAATHAGLWFDKFYDDPLCANENDKKRLLVNQVSEIPVPEIYVKFFEKRWIPGLRDAGATFRKLAVPDHARLVIGLGGESVIETHLTLNRTYGVPVISGTALKGLARRYAQELEGWTTEHTKEAFGNEREDVEAVSGCVTIFDALYIPESSTRAIHPDVMTVHHQDYYMKDGIPPADWDDPNPVSFLSTTGHYLLAVAGREDWVAATIKILEFALSDDRFGIGAKTSSGYGRLSVSEYSRRS